MAKLLLRLRNPKNKFVDEAKQVHTGPEHFSLPESKLIKDAIDIRLIEKVPTADLPPEEAKPEPAPSQSKTDADSKESAKSNSQKK